MSGPGVSCPTCDVGPTQMCVTADGTLAPTMHVKRLMLLTDMKNKKARKSRRA